METDMRDPTFRVELVFKTVTVFRIAIREYSIKDGKYLNFTRNENDRVRVKCNEKCSWEIYASQFEKDNPAAMETTYNNKHTCPHVLKNKHANSIWLAKRYINSIKPGKDFSVGEFMAKVRKYYVVQVSKPQIYRAKRKASILIQGTLKEQYVKLWDYAEELRRTIPGSTVIIEIEMSEDQTPIFKRIYVCLEACKRGWKSSCRNILGLDGCHTKGMHKAQLLVAIGIDADNSYYPVAYVVVEK
ncbi:uncharacterized protein LOC133806498 [Humulus lupulus]|uniref:uncharacterized protein LOC133806498 n=1 Tax=Humulus lupulus TaxID=3486 RepID=UPI002B409718|nr:uncharacterized protein LOC133806498 [Humulus lupulus]